MQCASIKNAFRCCDVCLTGADVAIMKKVEPAGCRLNFRIGRVNELTKTSRRSEARVGLARGFVGPGRGREGADTRCRNAGAPVCKSRRNLRAGSLAWNVTWLPRARAGLARVAAASKTATKDFTLVMHVLLVLKPECFNHETRQAVPRPKGTSSHLCPMGRDGRSLSTKSKLCGVAQVPASSCATSPKAVQSRLA
jgi:hypothetical protein